VKDGTLGDIGYVQADFFIGCHFGGFRELMDNPLLLDMAIHTFDEARFITGADPVSVYCHAFNPPGSWYKGNASANCIFEMSNGSVFVYNGSWSTEGCGTSWDANWRVAGTNGTAIWDGGGTLYAGILTGADGFVRETKRIEGVFDWPGRDAHQGCFDNIFDALNNGTEPETSCTDNIKSAAMLFGALESARTGQKIRIG
jgi:predicted dehydrogenase